MEVNQLAEPAEDPVFLGEWLYFITIMGTPSRTEPWGWQFSGHHAIVNFFVLGDQVVMTPLFLGSEPVRAPSGKYQGVVVLQQEQKDGLEMVRALTGAQQQKAILSFSKTGNNNLTEAFKDNVVLEYAGIQAKDLESSCPEAAAGLGAALREQHGRRARAGKDERSGEAHREYLVRMGRRHAREQCVLLPDSEPGNPD